MTERKFYVLGWGYGDKLKPQLQLMTEQAFFSHEDAQRYANTCHQAYRAFVVRESIANAVEMILYDPADEARKAGL